MPNKKLKKELNKKPETIPADQSANRRSLPIALEEETTMTEKREIGFENPTPDAADTGGWSLLTFSCPECGSHELLKSSTVDVVARVTFIGFELLDGNEKLDFNTECKEEGFDIHDYDIEPCVDVENPPDGSEKWTQFHRGNSDSFSCAKCGYELPVEDDQDLVCWLVDAGKIQDI